MKVSTIRKHRRKLHFWRRFRRPTPRKWGQIRNASSVASGCLLAGMTALNQAQLSMPAVFNIAIGISIFFLTGLAAYAQAHDDIPDKPARQEKNEG